MENKINLKKIIIAATSCLLLIGITSSNYYIRQYEDWANPISVTLIAVLWIYIIIQCLNGTLTIILNRANLKPKPLIPFFIYASCMLLFHVSPSWLYAEHYQSPITYNGCYEGTMNTGRISFRASGVLEYEHTFIFGFTTFEKGTWLQQGDTLIIKYENEVPKFVGDTLLLTESHFIHLNKGNNENSSKKFYRGNCKGLN